MTVLECIDEAVLQAGKRTDFNDARKLLMYNLAQKFIAANYNLNKMLVHDESTMDTVANAYKVTLPTDPAVKEIRKLVLEDTSNSREMKYRSPEWFDRYYPYPEAWSYTGKPWCFTIRVVGELEHFPIADAAYDMWLLYWCWPNDETVTTGDIFFTHYEEAMLEAMKYQMFKAAGMLDRAAASIQLIDHHVSVQRPSEEQHRIVTHEVEGYGGMHSEVHHRVPEYWKDPFDRGL